MAQENTNKEIKQISLEELIDVAKKYNSGEWNDELMNEYKQTLKIRAYIPLTDKIVISSGILFNYLIADDFPTFSIGDIYKKLFFNGLLENYAMVNCSNNEDLFTYENYDLLYPVFYDFIMSYCKEDYMVLKSILSDSMALSNIKSFLEAISNVTTESIQESIKNNNELINSLKENKDVIDKINNIAILNDPSTHKIIQDIRNESIL